MQGFLKPCLLFWAVSIMGLPSFGADAPTESPDGAGQVEACWPQFRGPNASGVAADGKQLPSEIDPRHPLWKTSLNRGHSSPCIWGDRIFLTGCDEERDRLETFCLDRPSGKILWRATAPAETVEKVHRFNSPATPTPCTDGRRVYVYFGSCGLFCYDFNGKEQWKLPLPMANTLYGSAASPIVAGALVLVNCDYPPQPYLLAVDCQTGKTVWRKDRPPLLEGYATPVLWSHDGIQEVVVHDSLRLAAYDLKDGAERWRVQGFSTASSTPVLGEGLLYVATWKSGAEPGDRAAVPTFDELLARADRDGDGLIRWAEFPRDLIMFRRSGAGPDGDVRAKGLWGYLDTNHDGRLDRNEWDAMLGYLNSNEQFGLRAIRPGGSGDATGTHVAWQERRAVPETPSPICYQGRIYLVKDGGIASCLDARSGKLHYRQRLGPGGFYFSSPVAGDGKLYVASHRGVLTVFAAGNEFRRLATADFQEPIVATPALADGKLYLRTESHLYAFGR